MTGVAVTFVTPYWSAPEMMRLHLASIREFHRSSPILVSSRGPDRSEMERYREAFGIRYWLEDCNYVDALLRLLQRCETEYVCVSDHDVVLLASLEPLLRGLVEDRWNLVGIEERISVPPELGNGREWLRYAPGYMDATLLIFNLRDFIARWGWRGIKGRGASGSRQWEYHYGICEKLTKHKYLRPFHARPYGLGNLVRDGESNILWHQWYGSHAARVAADGSRVSGLPDVIDTVRESEAAFRRDYPNLNLSTVTPAWAPDREIEAEAAVGFPSRLPPRQLLTASIEGWRRLGVLGLLRRMAIRLDRWWRVYAWSGPDRSSGG
jgi:hypothetical protein